MDNFSQENRKKKKEKQKQDASTWSVFVDFLVFGFAFLCASSVCIYIQSS